MSTIPLIHQVNKKRNIRAERCHIGHDIHKIIITVGKAWEQSRLVQWEQSYNSVYCPVLVLLSDGEDGAVKIWSKSGMLRTVLVQSGAA